MLTDQEKAELWFEVECRLELLSIPKRAPRTYNQRHYQTIAHYIKREA